MRDRDRVLEAWLFLSADPVPVPELADAARASEGEVVESLARLRENYAEGWRGIVLREVAGGFTLASHPVGEPAPRRLPARPPAPPPPPASAAYLEPVSRPEVARIRGVSSDSATASLHDRGLIEEAGRSPFGAVLYRTTELFLKLFGLRSNDELPHPAQWDPSREEEGERRARLLRAGEARAGVAPQADPAGTATD